MCVRAFLCPCMNVHIRFVLLDNLSNLNTCICNICITTVIATFRQPSENNVVSHNVMFSICWRMSS